MNPLEWVDDYVANVCDYVFVRVEDCVLIKRPNQAFRMNATAIGVLDRLFNRGERIADIVKDYRDPERVAADLGVFFRDLRCLLTHGLPDGYRSEAVDTAPFDYHFSAYPILSELAVTYQCNLKCVFCYAGCQCRRKEMDGNAAEAQMEEAAEAERLKFLLERIRFDAKVPSVSFTGGEPLLHPRLPELIRHARSLGLRVNLITNGTLCDAAMIQRLVEAGLNSAQVSLEGATPAIHDAVTGVAESYACTLAALAGFRDADIVVHPNTTLNRLNADDALRIPELVRSLDLQRFSMNLMIPAGAGRGRADLVIPYSEIGGIVRELQRRARRAGVEFMWYAPTPMCLFNPIAHGLGNKGCAACDGLLSIAPNGDVLPCSSYDEPVGNLFTEDFDRVWFGARATAFREKQAAPAECAGCEDFAACQGACPLYWREMGLRELPERIGSR